MSLRSALRTVFTLGRGVTSGLTEQAAGSDPIELFTRWFAQARESGILLPEAMTLATSSPAGRPSARMVLLKDFDQCGFVFYTNRGSRKADELDENPYASLVFHWPVHERQVRIEGSVELTSEAEASEYFATRPRGSQLAAWASRQSAELSDREQLQRSYSEYEQRFKGEQIPTPQGWRGYRVLADSIEFFQGRVNRLHDRLLYQRRDGAWVSSRLYP